MVDKSKLLVLSLILILVVSLFSLAFLVSQNFALTGELDRVCDQNQSLVQRLDMVDVLTASHVELDSELRFLAENLVNASKQLSSLGLSGEQACTVLSDLVAKSSFIFNVATYDLSYKMRAVVSSENYGTYEQLLVNGSFVDLNFDVSSGLVLTKVVALNSLYDCVLLASRVFDVDANQIGFVILAFNHVDLLNSTFSSFIGDCDYTVTITQTDSVIIYDSDASQIGKSLVDPLFAVYPQLLAFAHRVAEEPSGYGTYQFVVDANSNQVVHKQCYWLTLDAYGGTWRLALIHPIVS